MTRDMRHICAAPSTTRLASSGRTGSGEAHVTPSDSPFRSLMANTLSSFHITMFPSTDYGSTADGEEYETATKLWKSVMQEESRRDQQRRRMVKWRKQKKEKVADMNHERLRLEKELQLRLVEARAKSDFVVKQSGLNAFRHAMMQSAALKSENLKLQEAIEEHYKFQTWVKREGHDVAPHIFSVEVIPGYEKVKSQNHGNGRWRVFFPNGEPSFYFNPFSRKEFDDNLHRSDVEFAERHACSARIGKILGWTVDYSPRSRDVTGTAFIAHARFSRRIRCALDECEKILLHLDKNLWPVLVAPRSWGRLRVCDICCQVLQSFDETTFVLACNIPGDVNLRYFALTQHTREKKPDGKRVDKYTMTIGDSESNSLEREAEGRQEDVKWVLREVCPRLWWRWTTPQSMFCLIFGQSVPARSTAANYTSTGFDFQ
ncbi:unnamed protein product [Phytophthora lilii]|uniref:Unnamed protein product n=1 Tax=Phytophthora lilii TaxID=2077276 RepID=A0A9W6YEG1_9STRA|nr:unnamed protein product [Phytophthora lilii]